MTKKIVFALTLFPMFLFADPSYEAFGQTNSFTLTAGTTAGWDPMSVAQTELKPLKANLMTVAPNPTHGGATITLREPMKVAEVTVYNIAGKKLQNQNFSHRTSVTIDAGLPNGVYLVRLMVNSRMAQSTRFLVAR